MFAACTPPRAGCEVMKHPSYLPAQMLRKYSYPTCTFVILTARHSAVDLKLGPLSVSVSPSVPQSGSAGCNSLFDNLGRFAGVTPNEVEGDEPAQPCPEQRRRAKS